MKKSALPAALLLFGVGLTVSGCPVYDSEDVGCFDDQDCAYGYVCDGRSGSCIADGSNNNTSNGCNSPDDCGTNETCSHSGTCVSGDCHFQIVGCVNGYLCSSASGRWECVQEDSGNAGGATSGGAANGGEPASTDGGTPAINSSAGAGG